MRKIYAQRSEHYMYMRVYCPQFLGVKTFTLGMDSPKKAVVVDAHCSEVRKYMYHTFVHVLTWRTGDTRVCALCIMVYCLYTLMMGDVLSKVATVLISIVT